MDSAQSKEHSGGSPKIGLIPCQCYGETIFEITPVFEWQPESIDSFFDILAEHQARGNIPFELADMLLAGGIHEIQMAVSLAVCRTLAAIKGARDLRLAADQIAWISGISGMAGQSLGKLAKDYGLSKQAFQQGAEQYRSLLPAIRSQSARSEKSRQTMAERNYRPNGYAN